MEKTITKRQLDTLKLIYNSIKDSGFPPSMAEIRAALDVVSNQSVINLLKALEEKGFIKREEGLARGLRILQPGYEILDASPLAPLAGESSCGPFVEAIADVGKWIDLPRTVWEATRESQEKLYILEVHGDSMINVGIYDGDLLLIKQTQEYKNGDIVVARADDGTTVKRFVHENKKVYLKPENPAYPNIPFYDDLFLDGKVIANLSSLKRIYGPKNQ